MEAKANPWTSVIVKTTSGENLQLAQRWTQQRTILYLVRRFGCALCQHHGSVIMELKTALDKAGVHCNFVAVGGGSKFASDKFKQGTPWDGEVLLDATHATHKAMGLQRFTAWQAMRRYYLSHKALQFSKPLYERFKQSDFIGDAMQSGGVFILGPGSNAPVDYSFIEAEQGAEAVVDVFAMYKLLTGRELSKDDYHTIHNECVQAHAQAMARITKRAPLSPDNAPANNDKSSSYTSIPMSSNASSNYESKVASPHQHDNHQFVTASALPPSSATNGANDVASSSESSALLACADHHNAQSLGPVKSGGVTVSDYTPDPRHPQEQHEQPGSKSESVVINIGEPKRAQEAETELLV